MVTFFYVQGWTVCRKEPRMAVRPCPGMDCMSERAKDGGSTMFRDGLYVGKSEEWHGSTMLGDLKISPFQPARNEIKIELAKFKF